MNNLQCCAGGVKNVYLFGKTNEKVYVIAGPKFGEYEGCILLIVKTLYGLNAQNEITINKILVLRVYQTNISIDQDSYARIKNKALSKSEI